MTRGGSAAPVECQDTTVMRDPVLTVDTTTTSPSTGDTASGDTVRGHLESQKKLVILNVFR